jgi:hypothetical protein
MPRSPPDGEEKAWVHEGPEVSEAAEVDVTYDEIQNIKAAL